MSDTSEMSSTPEASGEAKVRPGDVVLSTCTKCGRGLCVCAGCLDEPTPRCPDCGEPKTPSTPQGGNNG